MDILIKPWQEAQKDAFKIRREVFILEQGVPADLEIDEFDPAAFHALAYSESAYIGTARLHINGDRSGQIGRMAVLSPFRNKGLGRQIMKALIELAKSNGISSLILHAQVSAIPFYEKLGFVANGPIYDEAGIPHRTMMMVLPT
ncbi:GNAT family N-acetyltransferase [Polynucleobacter sp. MWH-UH25E]|uniref:GNAT family N-acetyltransferase n=1 Tax=Polynucleobacter sp. MWH-UH25E TaxID=1855616 RepID=UPI001BFE3EE8|nr:GNAT family N-acetyltransferase [Polynucleobacter sp. MWH-UH25E]QWD61393.1 GNAT family N-acetyltransferase [Polynucleobacter sp. MWH-UH25E]